MPTQQVSFSKQHLKSQRERAGMSRTALGYHLDRTEQTVWAWEIGRTTPSPDMLGLIAAVLGCSLDDLFVVNEDAPRAGNGGASKTASGTTRHGSA